ncbi:MAG: carboxypeptidase regulatory-like domain-containing protein [Gemmatimonadaceae bacterium]|nr:carboxypeptidase regulatory-like domain-containing protein [Gemmatimonadaceae bacterium]MCW5826018.1 carboxypeptidase regulatory-like domain-containing protein [Gemmatimonadaceae bacterium]
MRLIRRTAAVLAALLVSTAPLVAQGSIRGTLVDSLRTGGPVVGADVVLMGASKKAVTARGGAFEFTDVPAGDYVVAYWAPWLDSLGLPAIQRQVTVRGRRTETVVLATPSNATIQRAVCGDVLGAEQGILIGEIRDPDGMPAVGTGVFARWVETIVQGREVAQGTMAAADSASASGSYALCGVPVGSEFTLRAIGAGGSSGELLVEAESPLHRRDIVVAPAGITASVTGRVLNAAGAPISGAAVLIIGDTAQSVRSDESGRFVLPALPRRSSQLMVRALGYTPMLRAVDPLETQLDLDVVTLQDAPRELATVTVTGQAMTASQLQFEARKERGLGVFVDDEQLRRLGLVSAQTIATYNPRVAVQQTRQGPTLLMRRGSEFCRPQFFIDGANFRDIAVDEENNFLRVAKRVEFYTANNAPPEFNDFAGCGSVVIWTF